jgi:hypothetical protein
MAVAFPLRIAMKWRCLLLAQSRHYCSTTCTSVLSVANCLNQRNNGVRAGCDVGLARSINVFGRL